MLEDIETIGTVEASVTRRWPMKMREQGKNE
jgi:hypothetical protein